MSVIVKRIERPNKDLIHEFSGLGVATIHESTGKDLRAVMDAGIKPIEAGMRLSGPAITVDCFPQDNSTLHIAMTLCDPGDVLVVDAHGMQSGMLGAQMAFQCVRRGIRGLIIDGGIRDAAEIKEMGFPCFSRHIHPLGTAKRTLGSINVPIRCGGVVVNPGDIVVGDDDGVAVVPKNIVPDVLERSKARNTKESKDRLLYEQGKTSMEMLGLDKLLDANCVRIIEDEEDWKSRARRGAPHTQNASSRDRARRGPRARSHAN